MTVKANYIICDTTFDGSHAFVDLKVRQSFGQEGQLSDGSIELQLNNQYRGKELKAVVLSLESLGYKSSGNTLKFITLDVKGDVKPKLKELLIEGRKAGVFDDGELARIYKDNGIERQREV